jgi:hypothetical protein
VVEGRVDDRIGCGGAGTQAVEILEAPALHRNTRGSESRRSGLRSRETRDGMAGSAEVLDDRGTHPARSAGNENTHERDFL